jgi:membrane protease YdiL (CAAX protease family)
MVETQSSRMKPANVALAFEVGIGGIAVALGWLAGYSPLATLSWSVQALVVGMLAAVPMLAAFSVSWLTDAAPFRRIREQLDRVLPLLFPTRSLVAMAVISAAAGLGEELLFRGLVQGALGAWLGPWIALVIASVLFGLVHAITPAYVVLATTIGGYLGWLWIATGNLLVPIAAHAFYDFVALVVLVKPVDRTTLPAGEEVR